MNYESEAGILEELTEDLPIAKASFWRKPEFWEKVAAEVVSGVILVLIFWFLVRSGGVKMVGGVRV